MTFLLIIMTSKHFWLLQSIWHQTRVTYLWCIANCSHWNHCMWSQELWEHKFLVLKKVLLFYRSMLRLSSQRSCDHIQWFQWLQVVKHHRYVTLVWCHVLWSSQKCLEVMIISTAMSCTKAVCAHCIGHNTIYCNPEWMLIIIIFTTVKIWCCCWKFTTSIINN